MAHHILGQSRTQTTLFPEVLDDFISEDNPVRVVDVFVDGLDLHALGFDGVIAKGKGRPGYHPAVMLKLYIYGYLNRVQSSRRLEKESNRNVELMWLLPVNQAFNPIQSTQCSVIKKVMYGEKGGLGYGLFSHDQILQAIYPNGNPLVSL